jgi:hypothetical protein
LLLATLAAVAFGMDLLRGWIPIAAGPAVLGMLAAMLARLAETRDRPHAAVLGRRGPDGGGPDHG